MIPLVSILIPAFNAERWIAQSLQSAVLQTWPHKEILVVDDGSTDRTLKVARGAASGSVSIVSQRNQGAAAARNTAFRLCRGDYIQWLDADDLLAPNKIEAQVKAAHELGSRVLLSATWGSFLYRHRRAEFVQTALWEDLSPVEWLIRKMQFNLHMQTATWLVSRELTEAAGPWDTRLLGDDDGEYFCRVLLASDGVKFVPEAKVFYRLPGSANLSYIGRSDRKLEAQFDSMQSHIRHLRSLEDSERVRGACVRYLQNWLGHFYPERLDIVSQAETIAAELGGRLEIPRLSWKYSWIKDVFGAHAAKRARLLLPQIKWSVMRSWDKLVSRVDTSTFAVFF